MKNNLFSTLFSDFYSPLKESSKRIFIIDFLRFLAIALMVIYHFTYDLNYFKLVKVDLHNGFWFVLPRIIVTLFLTSSALSFGLKDWSQTSIPQRLKLFTPRLIKLGFFAILISISTYFMFPNNWVYFGTLHCFFMCTLLSIFFLNYKVPSLIFGITIIINYIFKIIPIKDPLHFEGFKSVDFIPIYPWFGVFLIGYGLSHFKSIYSLFQHSNNRFISYTSQKTLPIYITHQVVLFSIVSLIASAVS